MSRTVKLDIQDLRADKKEPILAIIDLHGAYNIRVFGLVVKDAGY